MNTQIDWGMIGAVATIIGIPLAIISILVTVWLGRRQESFGAPTLPIINDDEATRARRTVLELVNNIWVKGVLEKSLYQYILIELGLETQSDAVVQPWEMQLQMPEQPDRVLPSGTSIVQIYDELNGALLILGEPGAGKTTTLLQLTGALILRAQQDSLLHIPVVFNLSSWSDPRQPIDAWLISELTTKYYVSKKIARSWVEQDALVLLLDGLDEVTAESREKCVEALNTFRIQHGMTPLVVCSRVSDYHALRKRLHLRGAVLICPLTLAQIDGYLRRAGTELVAISHILKQDSTLQEIVKQPLFLNIMTIAYSGVPATELAAERFGTLEMRRKHLFDAYIKKMFKREGRTKNELYSPAQTIHWLTWLATEMTRRNQSVFIPESVNSSWLPYSLASQVSRIVGMIVALVIGFLSGLLTGLFTNVIIGVIVGFSSGMLLWLIFAFTDTEWDGFQWRWQKVLYSLSSSPVLGIGGGMFFWVVLGLGGGLGLGLFGALVVGYVIGLIRELIAGPVAGLFARLMTGLFCILVGMIFGVVLFGFTLGGQATMSHYLVRLILVWNNSTPSNYVRFLDYASERILLRKVGSGYIFIHRMLLDHFAEREEIGSTGL